MKKLLLTLLTPTLACAQEYTTLKEPYETTFPGKEDVSLYRNLADTIKAKAPTTASSDRTVRVLGQYDARWAVVERSGFKYYVRQRALSSTGGGMTVLQTYEFENAPLPIDPTSHLITYEEIVQVPNATKDQLYIRAKAWVVDAYRSANAVIQMQDKEAGQIIVKGVSDVTIRALGMNNPGGIVRHTLTIYVKDGRYKYVLTNLEHEAGSAPNIVSAGPLEQEQGSLYSLGNMGGKKAWQGIKTQANRDMRYLVASLRKAMVSNASDF